MLPLSLRALGGGVVCGGSFVCGSGVVCGCVVACGGVVVCGGGVVLRACVCLCVRQFVSVCVFNAPILRKSL